MGDLARRTRNWASLHRWPWPVWRARGAADLTLAGERLCFVDAGAPELSFWAQATHRGRWEPATVAELRAVLRPGDVLLDVGAFVGAYTLLGSRLVGPTGRVIAFEPDARARARLERNLRRNGAANVTVLPCAVGDHAGPVRFTATGDSVGHVDPRGDSEVEMVTLDAVCATLGVMPDVIKLDVEGGELGVIPGSTVLREVRNLVLEIHEHEIRALGGDPERLLAQLPGWRLLERDRPGYFRVAVGPRGS